jgi:hypothetical protein
LRFIKCWTPLAPLGKADKALKLLIKKQLEANNFRRAFVIASRNENLLTQKIPRDS